MGRLFLTLLLVAAGASRLTVAVAAAEPAPRLITTEGSLPDTWRLDTQAFVFWCHRTVEDAGDLPWFGEFANVTSDDRARVTVALDLCMKRRLAYHGKLAIALPQALAAKAALGQALTSQERWMLGYVDHIVISDALVATAGGVKGLAPLLERPELRGVGEYWVLPDDDRSACAWVAMLGNARTTNLLRVYVSPACDAALPRQLPTLANLTDLTASAMLGLRWQKQLPRLQTFTVATAEPGTELNNVGVGAPPLLLPKMTRLRLGEAELGLLKHPPLPNVTELVIEVANLSVRHMDMLTASGTFPSLTSLELVTARFPTELQLALWKGLAFRQLRKLTVRANGVIDRREADVMMDSTALRGLHTLALEGLVPTAEALELLGNTRHASALKHLALRMAGMDGKKLGVLARARALRPQTLDLRNNPLGGTALAMLSNAPLVFSLQELRLAGSRVDDAGARALAGVYGMMQLVYLDLANNQLTGAGVASILRSASFASLIWLDVFTGHQADDAILCSSTQGARPAPAAPCGASGLFRRN